MKKLLVLITTMLGLIIGASPVAAAPAQPPGKPGELFTVTFNGVCTFPVEATVSGKFKDVLLDNKTISVAPGQKVTLSANGKTLDYVITGVRREVQLANGDYLSTVTGQNLLFNYIGASQKAGFWFVVGTFHYTLTEPNGAEVEPFNADGPGQVTDVCYLLK
ncbi:hypothetical protein [Arthrobacter oryzae]|uniref:hypothetical protein n=1 Tax=Arthrobacter oryzae TaxID=409290 RepID=UPI0030C9224E